MITETRYAIYTVAPIDGPLKPLADAWLGRDPDIDEPIPQPLVAEIPRARLHQITASPRRYGFHGTMKAPFVLAEGAEAGGLHDALEAFAAGCRPFEVPLKVASLGGFIALVPAGPVPELDELAAAVVREFDRFRAPLTEEERTRRRPERLSEAEQANLERWGYPYVMEAFQYHMTLTDRLEEPEHGQVKAVIERLFAPLLERNLPVAELALFTQTHRVAPFRVAGRFRFGG